MHLRSLLYLLVLLLTLTSCKKDSPTTRPVLVATIEPVRYVVEAIAGDRFTVKTVMPRGASPENFDPTPRSLMMLQEGKAVFSVGTLGFEHTRLPRMLENIPGLPLIALADSIRPLVSSHCHHGEEGGYDPHVWMSPRNLIRMAENTCRSLTLIDSLHADYYTRRLDSFRVEMNDLHEDLKKQLAPLTVRAFLIYHPSLGYFARDYGLEQLTVETDGKEPSAADIRLLVNRCRAEKVKTVFISEEHAGHGAQRIAESLGVNPRKINPLDYNVENSLREISNILAQ